MRYVVIGAGAIGGVVGGLLADAGREVALVARGAHGDAIRREGLTVLRPDGELHLRLPVAATIGELGLRPDDTVLVAVKSQQTAGVLADLGEAAVGSDRATDVLPAFLLQNGVANEDAALRTVAAVHGVCVNLPATHLQPGVVLGEGVPVAGTLTTGLATGGTDAVDSAVCTDLTAAGFAAFADDDVMAWKRAKLLRNLGNALEALVGREAADSDAARDLRRAATAEGRACFAAAALSVVDDATWHGRLADGRMRVAPVAGHERGGGSTWQSVERGQGSVETDFLNGEIVRLGRLTGTPTPVNALLQRETWRLLHEGAPAGSRSLADLRPSAEGAPSH